MGTQWMPSAIRDKRAWTRNSMAKNTGSVRVVVHTTEHPITTDPMAVVNSMANSGARLQGGYHVVMPVVSQYRPIQLREFSYAAGALRNSGQTSVSPNKQGTILIAVSLVAYAKNNHLLTDAGPWWKEFLDCVRSWGIPDTWIGPMPPGGGQLAPMPMGTWNSGTSGWCAHATVPAVHNQSRHWDPGQVNTGVVFGSVATTPPTQPPQQPKPPTDSTYTLAFDGDGTMTLRILKRTSPMMSGGDVRSLQGVLNQKGYNAGAEDGVFGDATKSAVLRAQKSFGITQDAIVGAVTMERLWER